MRRELGLVLSGGGARGAYQIGLWKAFCEAGVRFDGVAGTSVGAINGAMIVQNDLDVAVRLWSSMDHSDILPREIGKKLSFSDTSSLKWSAWPALLTIRRDGRASPLRDFLSRALDERRIRAADCEYFLCASALHGKKRRTMGLEDIPEGALVDYLLASAALPFVLPSRIDGKRYYDGGLHNNLPVSVLARRQYKTIVAVKIARGVSTPYRAGQSKIHILHPSRPLGSILYFEKESCRKNLELGFEDGRRAFRTIF